MVVAEHVLVLLVLVGSEFGHQGITAAGVGGDGPQQDVLGLLGDRVQEETHVEADGGPVSLLSDRRDDVGERGRIRDIADGELQALTQTIGFGLVSCPSHAHVGPVESDDIPSRLSESEAVTPFSAADVEDRQGKIVLGIHELEEGGTLGEIHLLIEATPVGGFVRGLVGQDPLAIVVRVCRLSHLRLLTSRIARRCQ